MMRPVEFREEAERDLHEIHNYLWQVSEVVCLKFEIRLAELLELIETMPYLHAAVWRRVRAAKIQNFPYVIYYIIRRKRIEVLAVIHGAREAAAWKSRL